MSNWLPVPFRQQLAEGYCLPACAEMVLAFYGVTVTQEQLGRLFETETPVGTPFSRISRLSRTRFGKNSVLVDAGKHATWDYLYKLVVAGKPCITAVDLTFIPYSLVDSRHVIVVIGCEADTIFVLDPAETAGVFQVAKDGFIAAWTEMECSYAVIQLS